MSKPKRGRNAKKIQNWRGTCPVCKRTRVKLLWARLMEDRSQQSVCKRCAS